MSCVVFAQRHFAENRVVAWIFELIFRVALPSYTSAWVYPIIYPLMASVPGCVGALTVFKVSGSNQNEDVLTWIGLVGSNLIIFVKVMLAVTRATLFADPALARLIKNSAR